MYALMVEWQHLMSQAPGHVKDTGQSQQPGCIGSNCVNVFSHRCMH